MLGNLPRDWLPPTPNCAISAALRICGHTTSGLANRSERAGHPVSPIRNNVLLAHLSSEESVRSDVREQRWPWLLTAGLMLASAAAAAWSTYLSWLRRMDENISEQAPWMSELLILAMALAGLAWLTLVLGLRWRLRTKAVAALPGLGTVAMALVIAVGIGEGELGEDRWPLTMLPVAVEWFALVALAAIWAWQPEVRGRRRVLRLAVALWGTTAFGIFHQMLAYMIMVGFSGRDWDGHPGTGYLTVAVITISAILILIMTLRTPKGGADDERQADPQSGSLSLA